MRPTRQLPYLAALLLLGLAVLGAAPPAVDLTGYYFLAGDKIPPAFADIDHLHLSTVDDRGGELLYVPLHGFIRMKPQGGAPAVDYRLVAPTLKGKAFTFTTKPVDGVSYRFAGNFLKVGSFPRRRPEGEVVLQGLLTKLQGDQKVAEGDVKLTYSGGD